MRSGAAREVREGEPSTRASLGAPDPARAPTRAGGCSESGVRCGRCSESRFRYVRARPECQRQRVGWRGYDRRTGPDRDLAARRPTHPAPGEGGRGARLRGDLDRRVPARGPVPRPRSCSTPPAARRRHRHREHVERARHRGRGVAPPGHRGPSRPLPARRRHRPPRGHAGVPQPLRHDRRLPRRPRRRGRARRGPGARRARAEGAARSPPSARRARTPTSPRRSTPASPARSSARARCSPRSRRWCSTPTRSRPARSAGPAVDRPYLHLRNYTSNLAAGLDRRRPRRRRQRRADRRARRARRRGDRGGRAHRAPRRGRGPRLPAAAHPPGADPVPGLRALATALPDAPGGRPSRDRPEVRRRPGGPAGRPSRSGGTARPGPARPPAPGPGAGSAGTTPRLPRPAARRDQHRRPEPGGERRRVGVVGAADPGEPGSAATESRPAPARPRCSPRSGAGEPVGGRGEHGRGQRRDGERSPSPKTTTAGSTSVS